MLIHSGFVPELSLVSVSGLYSVTTVRARLVSSEILRVKFLGDALGTGNLASQYSSEGELQVFSLDGRACRILETLAANNAISYVSHAFPEVRSLLKKEGELWSSQRTRSRQDFRCCSAKPEYTNRTSNGFRCGSRSTVSSWNTPGTRS